MNLIPNVSTNKPGVSGVIYWRVNYRINQRALFTKRPEQIVKVPGSYLPGLLETNIWTYFKNVPNKTRGFVLSILFKNSQKTRNVSTRYVGVCPQ